MENAAGNHFGVDALFSFNLYYQVQNIAVHTIDVMKHYLLYYALLPTVIYINFIYTIQTVSWAGLDEKTL